MKTYKGRVSGKFQNTDIPSLIVSQKRYELECLVNIYKKLQPKYVLEIGTQEGGTLYEWIKHAVPGAVICNIDILENQPQGRGEALIDKWHSWRRDDIELFTYIGHSQDPAAIEFVKAHLPRIDFAFIDGNHRYAGVKMDWENYAPMVEKGVVAFHDIMTPTSGLQDHITVVKLWNEIQHLGYITQEFWSEEKPSWGGIGVVYVQS